MGAAYPPAAERAAAWMVAQGWTVHPFQAEVWAAQAAGESGLLTVPTGAGKTYAATLLALCAGWRVLYVSPLRAMARDLEKALSRPVRELGLPARVETRTSDTSASVRARQRTRLPEVLVTTPESLSLLLTRPESATLLGNLGLVVVDEWHELIDNKRGTQVELALARLRRFSPGMRTWALSATLANAEQAARAVVGEGRPARVVRANVPRPLALSTLPLPPGFELPYSGHFGTRLAPALVDWIDIGVATLVFCNTRAQAEVWYQSIVQLRPEWFEWMGLHHGSIDGDERARVEDGLKSGELRLVVCTSSLDLGVDLAPVERVVQVGSPKGIARVIQRAGRSAHRPGATAKLLCVPTHALQLLEIVAVRDAVARGEVEPRQPLSRPIDVLAQHLVTCALGGGFRADEMFDEVRTAYSYRDLSRAQFDAALALVRDGGQALGAYPEFRKVVEERGAHAVPDPRLAALHRASVGTIVADSSLVVTVAGRGKIGTIDEGFAAALAPGDTFVFAGEVLEMVTLRDATLYARRAQKRSKFTPHWPGNKLPITGALGAALRRVVDEVGAGRGGGEIDVAGPMLAEQRQVSRIPAAHELLAEVVHTPEGHHLFLFPFEGRRVHEGLGALLALRAGRRHPATFTIAVDDHGLELLHADPLDWSSLLGPELFATEGLVDDILASVHISELMRRRFRDVARVAGFVQAGLPWDRKSARQVQASASLLFDVFTRYDPANPLLSQARQEVIEQHFEQERLSQALRRLGACTVRLVRPSGPSPLAAPILASRLSKNVASTETLEARVRRAARRAVASPPPRRRPARGGR